MQIMAKLTFWVILFLVNGLLSLGAVYANAPALTPSVGECHEQWRSHDRMDLGSQLIVGFYGVTPTDAGVIEVRRLIDANKIAGVVLLQRNIESPHQLQKLTSFLKSTRPCLIVAVDQEGGSVQRLHRNQGFVGLKSARRMADRHTLEEAKKRYKLSMTEMREMGINVNFAPVVDLDRHLDHSELEKRRFYGDDAQRVSAYASAFITACRSAGILCVVKHYPGLGSSDLDTHHVSVDVSDSWTSTESQPYLTLAQQGILSAVMLAHVMQRDVDVNLPASLSKQHVQRVRALNPEAIVVTDSLNMSAITNDYDLQRVISSLKETSIDWYLWVDIPHNSLSLTDFVDGLHMLH